MKKFALTLLVALASIVPATAGAQVVINPAPVPTCTANQILKFSGTVWECADASSISGVISGSGTTGKLPRWTSTTALGDSIMSESGTVISIAGTLTATSFTGAVVGNATTATALATPRAIYGNNFDGSAALSQIIASTYGGTGNGFAKFSGPTTSEKTFTLPNANDTIATYAVANAFTTAQSITRAGIATTSTTGLQLVNTTASTSGVAVQYSPGLLYTSHAWNTTATAVDNYLEMIAELRPTSASTPTSTFVWGFRRSTDGATGSFTDVLSLTSTGQMHLISGASASAGMKAEADGVMSFLNNAGTGYTRACWGPCTASFPALKRNGANFDVITGSDSTFSSMRMSTITLTVTSSAGLVANTTNSVDLFSSGTPGRSAYFGTSVVTPVAILNPSSNGGMDLRDGGFTFGQSGIMAWTSSTEAGTKTLRLGRQATGSLLIDDNASHGFTMLATTDSTADFRSRAGADTAIVKANKFTATASMTFNGSTSGTTVVQATAIAGTTTLTLPAVTGTLQTTTGSPAAFVIASQASGDLLYASSSSAWARLPKGTDGDLLTLSSGVPAWTSSSSAAHNILSATHSDTLADSVARGDIMIGNSTPKWSRLAKGSANTVLMSDGSDVAWSSNVPLLNAANAFTDATDASSSTTGALKTAGGLGIAKKLYVGTSGAIGGGVIGAGNLSVSFPGDTNNGVVINETAAAADAKFLSFRLSGSSEIGSVSRSGSGSAVLFTTTSDARAKYDLGPATSLAVLTDTIIHDFAWRVDGSRDRGVFAQEAFRVKPNAVHVGTDERDALGGLANPWAVDYSKYVADLIVGWQSHQARIAALEAQLAALQARVR